ncbi:hypothetical protein BAUCODRAFT_520196 [Baudoinia panamericana UAMH 10762]|uniref:Uncharacterized protein n=1 Tax=Baudoinia panamericana (strain UAMH 10762) TaxID=717646 RepID=M2N7B8_BAUPA|nr:uncharacterized protein BAUCODRAFT_520196 [Baudoinia panamericana UAMH 10762]EMC94964.1 hypothetical protein BAUCODRAFT_520196 [Baudoinia panamericana UAMH 10762]
MSKVKYGEVCRNGTNEQNAKLNIRSAVIHLETASVSRARMTTCVLALGLFERLLSRRWRKERTGRTFCFRRATSVRSSLT